jgi:hypothetical protein
MLVETPPFLDNDHHWLRLLAGHTRKVVHQLLSIRSGIGDNTRFQLATCAEARFGSWLRGIDDRRRRAARERSAGSEQCIGRGGTAQHGRGSGQEVTPVDSPNLPLAYQFHEFNSLHCLSPCA